MHIAASSILALGALMLLSGCIAPRQPAARDLTPLLESAPDPIPRLLASAATNRVQILISEARPPSERGAPLRRWGFRVDAEYFYPASSIKLCAAVSALQLLQELEAGGAPTGLVDAPMEIAPLFPGDAAQVTDPSHLAGGTITVGHEIRKLCLVSDNPAFNRLFDLVGHERLNTSMHGLGLRSTVINHRLSESRTLPDPKASAAVRLLPRGARTVELPARTSRLDLSNSVAGLQVGSAYLSGTRRVDRPMDFTTRNRISLSDLHDLMIKVARPDLDLGTPPLRLSDANRRRLLDGMTVYPRESTDPVYPAADHPDEFCKFLLPGVRKVFPSTQPGERVEIAGKIGRAYGFTVENSHLRNPATGRELFVTAVIYTNEDGVLNDDRYEYDSLADPFMSALGEWAARKWLK